MGRPAMNRREAMASLLALSAAGALTACSDASESSPSDARSGELDYATPTEFFTVSEMTFLSAVANTIIPDSDTPGAAAAGVPDTLQGLASVWGDDDYRRYWRRGIQTLNATLSGAQATDFVSLPHAARSTALAQHDADVFAGVTEDGFYRDLKATVVQAYYMSEPGATQELAYEPVPGAWIGCVPLADYPKTWAT